MRRMHRQVPVALVVFLAMLSVDCRVFLWRNRPIVRHDKNGKIVTQAAPLTIATREELLGRVETVYKAIDSFQATVDMTPSVGSVYKGQITEYKDVRAFVLFRKPSGIRIIGQLPVVRTKAFDMVSDGEKFRFFLPSKNLFVEGDNNAPAVSKNQIENLRPDAFLSSMLIRPPDTSEAVVLDDATDEENALYILHFLRKKPDGQLYMSRSVWFDRIDLTIVRQKIQDEQSVILSDTRYRGWMTQGAGVLFPSHIDINRPKDGYGVVMDLVKIEMNKELTNEQLTLTRPEGSTLQTIGAAK